MSSDDTTAGDPPPEKKEPIANKAGQVVLRIQLIKQLDESEWEILISMFEPRLQGLLYLAGVQNAEDRNEIVQETYARAIQTRHRLSTDPDRLYPTFATIARRIAINRYRRVLVRKNIEGALRIDIDLPELSIQSNHSRADGTLNQSVTTECIEKLLKIQTPKRRRITEMLVAGKKMNFKKLGYPTKGAYEKMVYRCKQDLLKALGKETNDNDE